MATVVWCVLIVVCVMLQTNANSTESLEEPQESVQQIGYQVGNETQELNTTTESNETTADTNVTRIPGPTQPIRYAKRTSPTPKVSTKPTTETVLSATKDLGEYEKALELKALQEYIIKVLFAVGIALPLIVLAVLVFLVCRQLKKKKRRVTYAAFGNGEKVDKDSVESKKKADKRPQTGDEEHAESKKEEETHTEILKEDEERPLIGDEADAQSKKEDETLAEGKIEDEVSAESITEDEERSQTGSNSSKKEGEERPKTKTSW